MIYGAADILALITRTVDASWLDGIQSSADGVAMLNALAAIGAEVSRCVDDGAAAPTIYAAPGGHPGAITLTLTRSLTTNAVVVPAGYVFRTTAGVQLRVPYDVAVPAGVATIYLTLETVRSTEAVNTWDDFTFTAGATGSAISDAASPLVVDAPGYLLGPPGTTVNTVVTTSTNIYGAMADWLSAIGNERGTIRYAGEAEADYRRRIRNLPDNITPIALARAMNALATARGLGTFVLQESFQDNATAATKAAYNLGNFSGFYCDAAGHDFFDDMGIQTPDTAPREVVTLREAANYFRAIGPPPPAPGYTGFFFDDSPFCDDPVGGYPDFGPPLQVSVAMVALYDEMVRKKAAGVTVDVIVDATKRQIATATETPPFTGNDCTVTAPTGKVWWLVRGTIGASLSAGHAGVFDGLYIQQQVVFHFDDATTWTSSMCTVRQGMSFYPSSLINYTTALRDFPAGKRITSINCYSVNSTSYPVTYTLQVVVIEITA